MSAISAGVFDKHADAYRAKYMDLALYDASYDLFCSALARRGGGRGRGGARVRVLDAACGPGNAARYLLSQRPDLELLGIDLAPRMVALAGEAVPAARFAVHDCRRLEELGERFDGILCAFGLPYLSCDEAAAFIKAAAVILTPGGVLFLSTMLGRSEDSGLQACGTGDQIFIQYHREEDIVGYLEASGFAIFERKRLASPANASKQTTDLVVIARLGGSAEGAGMGE